MRRARGMNVKIPSATGSGKQLKHRLCSLPHSARPHAREQDENRLRDPRSTLEQSVDQVPGSPSRRKCRNFSSCHHRLTDVARCEGPVEVMSRFPGVNSTRHRPQNRRSNCEFFSNVSVLTSPCIHCRTKNAETRSSPGVDRIP